MCGMKESLYRYACLLLCFCALLLAPFGVHADEAKAVRVGWYEDAYNITGQQGQRSGYGYEYQQAVAAYTGWSYEYVRAGWSDLLQMVQTGTIDIMSGVSYTPERAQTMLFSELPMGTEKYYLYVDLQHTDILASDLQTLNGRRICLLEGSIQATEFYKWEREHNLQTQHVFVNSFEAGKELAARHEIDGVISTETPHWVQAGMSAIATTGSSGIYFAINKNRPDLKKELDEAMRKMEYDKPFYAEDLYKRYLMASSVPVLSGEEQVWLARHGVIRIGYLDGDAGFSELDKARGELKGVLADYIRFAADCLGNQALEFSLHSFATQAELLQALQNGKIDMIFHNSQNPYFAEQNGFILSNTALTVTMPVITAQTHFDEDAANIVAVEKDDFLTKSYLAYNYPKWQISEYNSLEDAEEAVRKGQAACLVTKYKQLTKYIADKGLHGVFLTQPCNVAFAVSRGNTLLLSILNKTLKAMPPAMLTGALSMYDNSLRKVTMMDFVKDNLVAVATGCTAVFLVILLVVLSLLRKARLAANESQSLNKKLQTSQTELQAALQKAENANAAKTNFLFNMSHDIRTPMNALLGYTKMMKDELKDEKLLSYQEKMEQSGNLLLSIINNVLDMARIESGKMELDENYARVGDIIEEICEVFAVEAKKKNICLLHEKHVEHEHIMCDATKVKEIFTNLLSNAIKYTAEGGTVILRTEELPCPKPGYVCIRTEVIDNGIGMSKEYLPTIFDAFSRERNTTAAKVGGTGLGMAIVKNLVKMLGGTIDVESELGRGSRFTVTLEHCLADDAYYEQQEKAAQVVLAKEHLKGKHILLAEDNELNAEIALFILQSMGLVVERVEDGVQCVSHMETQPAGTYDLIFMDVQMPHMDGYKATRAIRSFADKAKAAIPIVAMTANAFEEDKRNAFAAGMNGHIAKPIDAKKVEQTLLELLS